MSHTIENRAKLVTRVRKIKGQAEGLEKLLTQGGDCNNVLQQIAAIRGAVNGLMAEVLDGHIREHLGPEATDAAQRAKDVEQLAGIIRSYLK
ncbi:metal/formaldehyde-sensitive transcriptional repressor [Venatoribacter cucullus]|uniref:metal/formaldehyde-sensitive transcriptional repressor n=1 Tax=Venatoribacter cucullus TaxID=2661630 RepID=UPI001934B693|nr:metal/formaldehyde-sensitive transcriptional repressor [Venatoribacter cucullus]QQD21514.1 metal-sensing transcriptional repressor [Oceanospirillaceae bacterium ASx5O]UZK03621.1 metal-sensing transcriptional repressor [Venatoribacter cucullus]